MARCRIAESSIEIPGRIRTFGGWDSDSGTTAREHTEISPIVFMPDCRFALTVPRFRLVLVRACGNATDGSDEYGSCHEKHDNDYEERGVTHFDASASLAILASGILVSDRLGKPCEGGGIDIRNRTGEPTSTKSAALVVVSIRHFGRVSPGALPMFPVINHPESYAPALDVVSPTHTRVGEHNVGVFEPANGSHSTT
jgi:hypothetical protein